MLRNVLHGTRLVIATVIGWSLIAVGLVLLVTPGPGLLAIAGGAALLAPHFSWLARLRAVASARAVGLAARAARTQRTRSGDAEAHGRPAGAPSAGPTAQDLASRSAA